MKYTWYDWIFLAYIVCGILIGLTSTVFFINNLPLSGSTAVVMGLVFSIGAKIDWNRFKERMNKK